MPTALDDGLGWAAHGESTAVAAALPLVVAHLVRGSSYSAGDGPGLQLGPGRAVVAGAS